MSSITFSLLVWRDWRGPREVLLCKYPRYLALFADTGNEWTGLPIEQLLYALSCFLEGGDHLIAGPVAARELNDARLVTDNGLTLVWLVSDFDVLRESDPPSLARF